MTMPQRLRRLSIVFTYLSLALTWHIPSQIQGVPVAFNGYPGGVPGSAHYQVIDVAHQHHNDNKLQTGETTRIFTTGVIDDNFWLKHLGEDFKRAIHLQVGDNEQVNGSFNMTEDGSRYQVHHEYASAADRAAIADGNDASNVYNMPYPTERVFSAADVSEKQKSDSDSTTRTPDGNEKKSPTTPQSNEKATGGTTNNNTSTDEALKTNEEEQTKDDDVNLSIKYFDHENKKSNKKLRKHLKYNNTNTHTAKYNTKTHTNTNINTSRKRINPNSLLPAPIVVNLPDTQKTVHHIDDSNVPVVVKMPPVIYHQKPTQQELEEHTHTDTENTQTPTKHDTESHNPDSQLHQYTAPHQTKSTTTHHNHPHEKQHDQKLSDQQGYDERNLFNPPPFEDTGFTNPDSQTYKASTQMRSENSDVGPKGGLRYIVAKAPSSQCSSCDSSFTPYSRIGRSSQDIFEKGL